MSSNNEDKRLPINSSSAAAASSTSTTSSGERKAVDAAIVDLDHAHGDYTSFMGGSAAYGRTAFAQGTDQFKYIAH
jgi:hypothetical protein